MTPPVQIAIFASGSGSNAENIIEHFQDKALATVKLVLSNKPQAKVLDRAKRHGVNTATFTKSQLYKKATVLNKLKEQGIDLIVLAGFLWLVPSDIIKEYQPYIVNIHPALLPQYGGKGMYGKYVHQAVLDNKEKETGITIHHVNEEYDDGDIIFQEKCKVHPNDNPDTLAKRVKTLEHEHYPKIIEKLARELTATKEETTNKN